MYKVNHDYLPRHVPLQCVFIHSLPDEQYASHRTHESTSTAWAHVFLQLACTHSLVEHQAAHFWHSGGSSVGAAHPFICRKTALWGFEPTGGGAAMAKQPGDDEFL